MKFQDNKHYQRVQKEEKDRNKDSDRKKKRKTSVCERDCQREKEDNGRQGHKMNQIRKNQDIKDRMSEKEIQ